MILKAHAAELDHDLAHERLPAFFRNGGREGKGHGPERAVELTGGKPRRRRWRPRLRHMAWAFNPSYTQIVFAAAIRGAN